MIERGHGITVALANKFNLIINPLMAAFATFKGTEISMF